MSRYNPNPNPNPPTHHSYVGIVDHQLPYDTHNLYDVTFHNHSIHTLLTSDPPLVDRWISETLRLHPRRQVTAGLDVEWRPNVSANSNNPVAVVQLCVANRCLVFQILHAPFVPDSLAAFLGDARNTFLGVGIEEDVEKLLEDYSLSVANFVDLRYLAAERFGDRALRGSGLKTLSLRVLGLELEKPQRISRSRWDNLWLNAQQVQYACLDAFVSYEVGRCLIGF